MTLHSTAMVNSTGQATQGQEQSADIPAKGSYGNREVTMLKSSASPVQNAADAAEEMTTNSELAKKREEKDAGKRNVRDKNTDDILKELMKLGEISEILDKLGDLDRNTLEKSIQNLLRRRDHNSRSLQEQAGQEFEEPAHQYALLKAYESHLKKKGAPEKEILTAGSALSAMMKGDTGIDVRSALNTGKITNEYADKKTGTHKELRSAYRNNIKDYTNLNDALKDLEKNFPGKKFSVSIKFITRGLAADMAVDGSSIDKNKLEQIASDMTWLKSSSTIMHNCEIVVQKYRKQDSLKSFDEEYLFKTIVTLQSAARTRYEQFCEIPDKAGFEDHEKRINLLTDITSMIRLIPVENYPSGKNRENFILVAQYALDQEIKDEENSYYEDDDDDE